MLEAPPAGFPNPLFAFFGETCPKIVQGPLPAAVIVFPQHSTEKTGGPEIGFDIEEVKENYKDS